MITVVCNGDLHNLTVEMKGTSMCKDKYSEVMVTCRDVGEKGQGCKNLVIVTQDGEGDIKEKEVGVVMMEASHLEKRGGEKGPRGFRRLITLK